MWSSYLFMALWGLGEVTFHDEEWDIGGFPIAGSLWHSGKKVGHWGPTNDENYLVTKDGEKILVGFW